MTKCPRCDAANAARNKFCAECGMNLRESGAAVHMDRGYLAIRRGDVDEAVKEYREALRIDPSDSRAHRELAAIYYHRDMLPEALEENKRAVELDPEFGIAHYELGTAYYRLGMFDEATAAYEAALRARSSAVSSFERCPPSPAMRRLSTAGYGPRSSMTGS